MEKRKSLMKYKFYCDENITKKLQNTIKRYGFQVDSVRNQKLFGIKNGDFYKHQGSNLPFFHLSM